MALFCTSNLTCGAQTSLCSIAQAQADDVWDPSVQNGTDVGLAMGARWRMSNNIAATDMADESTRWAAWVARGVEEDRKTQKYTRAVAVTVAVVLAASLVIAFAAR